VTVQPDTDPRTIEWARKPPAPLLEALETLYLIWDGYEEQCREDPGAIATERARVSYQTAFNVVLRAFAEEYAP
jgi:hypothetical protein